MTRTHVAKAAGIACSLSLAVTPVAAADLLEGEIKLSDAEVPLNAADHQAITLEVLKAHPMLSASPGIKSAQAWRGTAGDVASVVFYPHSDSGGTKYAFQARCKRENAGEAWSCPEVESRRYLKLDSQDFEVRVTGDLERESALSLIQATRRIATVEGKVPNTAIMIFPANGGYVVSWGSPEGYRKLDVEANLKRGGNPANSDDWETRLLPTYE